VVSGNTFSVKRFRTSVVDLFIVKLQSSQVLDTCSFICQGTSIRRQRSDLFGLRVKLPPLLTSLTTQR